MAPLGEVPNAKAIIGAVFIQYLFYGFIYILEGTKWAELHPRQGSTATPPA